MKLNKFKTTILITMVALSSYGANQLYKNVNVTYSEVRPPVTQQTALNQPVALPQFALNREIDSKDQFWADRAQGR